MNASDLKPSILEFKDLNTSKIYVLICDVYTTSDRMSETLEEKFPTLESFEQYINELSKRPGNLALVAETGGEPCGYLTIMPRYQAKLSHTSELNMGVHHAVRGKGIGKALLKEALQRSGTTGIIEIIYLMVRSDNTPAIGLYEDMGFDHLALLEKDIKTPECYYDGHLMRKFVK